MCVCVSPQWFPPCHGSGGTAACLWRENHRWHPSWGQKMAHRRCWGALGPAPEDPLRRREKTIPTWNRKTQYFSQFSELSTVSLKRGLTCSQRLLLMWQRDADSKLKGKKGNLYNSWHSWMYIRLFPQLTGILYAWKQTVVVHIALLIYKGGVSALLYNMPQSINPYFTGLVKLEQS